MTVIAIVPSRAVKLIATVPSAREGARETAASTSL